MAENPSIIDRICAAAEENYGDFNAKLIPTVPREQILGVRLPILRALARELRESPEAAVFLDTLPHAYHEENCLHAFLLEQIRDYDRCLAAVERFLPYVDNWAVCDSISPKCFRRHRPELLSAVRGWLASERPYTKRFGIKMLMAHFLDEAFSPEYLDLVSVIESEEYYVNMMRAWYFATALAKQYESTVPLLEDMRLDRWTHNKTVQKAVEGYRISPEQKEYLKTLRR